MTTSADDALKIRRSLSAWRGARKVAGVLVIVATVLMISCAIMALWSEADASRAMKVPFCAALAASLLFVRSGDRVRKIEATLRRRSET
jgi:hypothetical protein